MASDSNPMANMMMDDVEKPFDYKYYFHLFKKNLAIVGTLFIVAVTIATIYAAKLPDEYRSKAQLLIERPQTAWQASEFNEVVRSDIATRSLSEEYYNTQEKIMLGPSVLRKVIDELRLGQYFETDNRDSLVGRTRGLLSVGRVRSSRIFEIVAITDDPEFSAKLANAVARNYIQKISRIISIITKKSYCG